MAGIGLTVYVLFGIYELRTRQQTGKQIVFRGLCAVYIALLVLITFGTRLPDPKYAVDFIPFHSLYIILRTGSRKELFETVLNFVMFIPLGILYPWTFSVVRGEKKGIGKTLTAALQVSVFIEIIQFVTRFGCLAFDDIFCNAAGAFCGCILWTCVGRMIVKLKKTFMS